MTTIAMNHENVKVNLQHALNGLAPKERTAFALRHYRGYKLKEIARAMKCAEGTARKHLLTASARMRQQLKDIFHS